VGSKIYPLEKGKDKGSKKAQFKSDRVVNNISQSLKWSRINFVKRGSLSRRGVVCWTREGSNKLQKVKG